MSYSRNDRAFSGGTMVPGWRAQIRLFQTDAQGSVIVPGISSRNFGADLPVFYQFWTCDPLGGAPDGVSASNALSTLFPTSRILR